MSIGSYATARLWPSTQLNLEKYSHGRICHVATSQHTRVYGRLREPTRGAQHLPKLFVANMPSSASDSLLKEWIESHGFGVESAQVIRDRGSGVSRGFGFVILKEEGKLKDAITQLNGKQMGERMITVSEAIPLPSRHQEDRRD
jgi:cold-inducible RNA-binding protein